MSRRASASAASTVAENSSQLLKPGAMTRVDSSAAIRFRFVAASSDSRSARGARNSACARNAASTSGCRSRVKLRKSGDDGSTARAIARRARSAYSPRSRAFGGGVRGQLDPRRHAREQPADRLEMRDVLPIRAGGLLDRHARLQRAGREILQNRIGEPAQQADPDRTIVRRAAEPSVRSGRSHRRRLPARRRLEQISAIRRTRGQRLPVFSKSRAVHCEPDSCS